MPWCHFFLCRLSCVMASYVTKTIFQLSLWVIKLASKFNFLKALAVMLEI